MMVLGVLPDDADCREDVRMTWFADCFGRQCLCIYALIRSISDPLRHQHPAVYGFECSETS